MLDRKRILAGGVALAALTLTPASPTQARINLNPSPSAAPTAPPHAIPAAPAAAAPGFQWDDAAVGALAGAALLGTAALGGGAARRRRARPLPG